VKVGELLAKEELPHFSGHVRTASEAKLGAGAVVSWTWLDERTAQVTGSKSGEFEEVVYRWELGGGFDLDGDGELG